VGPVLGAFPALASRPFRRYLAGLLISLVGTWLQQTALALLAYRLTGSSVAVGAVLACSQLPILLLSPLAGAVNDRVDRRHALICTQLAGLVQAACLAAVSAAGALQAPGLFCLATAGGLINAFDAPARQAVIASLVERRADLRSAVALSAAGTHVARLAGPALAAVLMGRGPSLCFAVNAVSSALFAGVLLRTVTPAQGPVRRLSLHGLTQGWAYCLEHAATRQSLLWIASASLLAIPYTSLLPAAAHRWAVGAAGDYPVLLSMAGVGALAAAFALARIPSDAHLRRAIPVSLAVAALCLASLGWGERTLPPAWRLAAIASLGFTLTIVVSGANVILQNAAPEALRGRITGLFVMLFNGVVPLGALLWGIAADRLGLPFTFQAAGGALALLVIGRAVKGYP